jgi:hypothetical protein
MVRKSSRMGDLGDERKALRCFPKIILNDRPTAKKLAIPAEFSVQTHEPGKSELEKKFQKSALVLYCNLALDQDNTA